jgi:arylsulfatase A-like enzyme
MKNIPIRNLLITGVIVLMFSLVNVSCGTSIKNETTKSSKSNIVNNSENQPNVIMFIMDDLNDWVTPLGYEQVKTPNLDRLAKSGVIFKNAHAPGVFCAPSRTAIFTGMYASTTGCYENEIFRYDHPQLETIQMAFNNAGYNAYGAGKIYHHRSGYVDLRGWEEYFTRSQEVKDMAYEMNSYHMSDVPLPEPYPYSPYYRNSDRGGSSALHLEWGPIPNEKEDEMTDAMRTNWMCDVLKRKHDKPFFMALGMYSPHYPNYAPQKYFDMYDRDELELPPYKEDDLDDLSPAIRKFYTNRSKQHAELEKYGALKDALHGYLASISFADAMLGRLLDALESSSYSDNTIVVFWSDQGFHHGEKGHWGKHTLWQRTTQVPFIWAGKGIAKNAKVETPVSLIDIYPSLVELCNLQVDTRMEGVSLVSDLQNPSSKERNVFIPHADRNSYAVVNSKWRYIYYYDGSEELYNLEKDPNEWDNLIGDEKYNGVIKNLKKSAPVVFAPAATPRNDLELIVEGDSFRWEKKSK